MALGRVIWAFTLAIFQGCSVEGKIVSVLQAHKHKTQRFMVSVYHDLRDTAASPLCPLSCPCLVVLSHQCHLYSNMMQHSHVTVTQQEILSVFYFHCLHQRSQLEVREQKSDVNTCQPWPSVTQCWGKQTCKRIPRRCILAGRRRCHRCRGECGCSSGGNECSWSTRSVEGRGETVSLMSFKEGAVWYY